MAFRASTFVPALTLQVVKRNAWQARQQLVNLVSAMTTGASSEEVFAAQKVLVNLNTSLTEAAAVPGIVDYAVSQEDDVGYDVVAEFTAMNAAIDAAIATIISGFPKDGSNFLLSHTFAANGTLVARNFTPAQLASAVAAIQAVIDSIV